MATTNPADIGQFYQRLSVDPSASPDEIRQAYRAASHIWHPDKNDSPHAHTAQVALNRAFEILLNPNKRASYDIMQGIAQQTGEDLSGLSEVERALRQNIDGFGCTHANHTERYDNDCNGKPSFLMAYLLASDFRNGNPRGRVDLVCESFVQSHGYNDLWPELIDNYAFTLFQVLHNTTTPESLVNALRSYEEAVIGEVRSKLEGMNQVDFFVASEGYTLIADWNRFQLSPEVISALLEEITSQYRDIIGIFSLKLPE